MDALHDFAQFERLPLMQLQELLEKLERLIALKQRENRDAALAEISRLAGDAGLTAEVVTHHLGGKRSGRRRAKLAPKYRDSDNTANTWAGRGRRPKWLESKLARGAQIEDFAITPETGAQA